LHAKLQKRFAQCTTEPRKVSLVANSDRKDHVKATAEAKSPPNCMRQSTLELRASVNKTRSSARIDRPSSVLAALPFDYPTHHCNHPTALLLNSNLAPSCRHERPANDFTGSTVCPVSHAQSLRITSAIMPTKLVNRVGLGSHRRKNKPTGIHQRKRPQRSEQNTTSGCSPVKVFDNRSRANPPPPWHRLPDALGPVMLQTSLTSKYRKIAQPVAHPPQRVPPPVMSNIHRPALPLELDRRGTTLPHR